MRSLVLALALLAASPAAAAAQSATDEPSSPAPALQRYAGPAPAALSGMGVWRQQVLNAGSFADWLVGQGIPTLDSKGGVPFDRLGRRHGHRRPHTGPDAVVNDATTPYEPRFPLMTYQVGPSVAASGGNVLVGFSDSYGLQDFVTGVTSYGYSTDGGTTWVDAGGLPRYGYTYSFVGDPVVTRDDAGRFYLASIVFDYQGDYYAHDVVPGIAVGRGRFEGGAFVWDTVTIVVRGKDSFWDKEWIAADPASGDVYLTYSRFTFGADLGRVELMASHDGGRSWDPPVVVADADGFIQQGSRPVVGSNGEVYVVWEHGLYEPAIDEILVRRSDDHGRTFGPAHQVRKLDAEWRFPPPGSNRPYQHFPVIAVDRSLGRSRGDVYVAWNESATLVEESWDGVAQDEQGDNDTVIAAQRVHMNEDVVAQMDREDDQDWYRLRLRRGEAVVIRAEAEWPSNPVAFIRCGPQSNALAGNDDDYGTTGAILKYVAQWTGDIFIQVVPKHFQALGDYRLTVRRARPAPCSATLDMGDILVSRSRDGGETWSAAERVNDGPPYGIEVFPALAVNDGGDVMASWVDARDGTECSTNKRYYGAIAERGHRFGRNFALADTALSWFGFTLVAPNFGDYTDVAADASRFHGVWTDARDGTPDIWTAWADPRRGPWRHEFGDDPIEVADAAGDEGGPVGALRAGLAAIAPNPASSGASLAFTLAAPSSPSLRVFDLAGRHVATLLEGRVLPGGQHARFWDLRDGSGHRVPAGVYLARWENAGASETRRLVVLPR